VLVQEKKVRLAIITSAKDSFCVGADLEQLYPVTDPSIGENASRDGQKHFTRIQKSTYPIVAAVNGLALGGGCELALACHHRLIASNTSMGLPETLLGLLPGAGGTVRLQKLIGIQNALQWILKGAPVKADKCKKQGAVDAVIPAEARFTNEQRFFEGVRAWSGKLVDKPLKPAAGKPKSFVNRLLEDTNFGRTIIIGQATKMLDKLTKKKYLGQYAALKCVIYAASFPAEKAYEYEAKTFGQMLVTPEAKNQCSLYFLEDGTKKLEKKTGLSKEQIPPVTNVGVIGAGVMGSGVAHYYLKKNYGVSLKDISEEAVAKGIAFIDKEFQGEVKKKKLDEKGKAKKMAKLVTGTEDAIFKNCEVIVEAAVEVMSIKKKMLQSLEEQGILDGKRIFATNTSSLSLTELQSVSKYPQQVVGMHFFNPVAKMPLVEVIKGQHTSKEAVAAIYQLALKSGKKPIIVNDAPGFLVNRILGAYMAEAGRLAVQDRADPVKIDKVISSFGMPMGPFRLLDEVGLDVACHVGPVLENGLKSKRFAVDKNIEKMVADGFLGKKNNKGFYQYDPKGKETNMNTTVTSKYLLQNQPADSTFNTQDILDRCVLMMVNEASMILSEGVAATPEDVDIGMVWGTGFPPFRGGLLQYADHRGIPQIVDRLKQLRDKVKDERFAPSEMLAEMAAGKKRFFPDRPFVPYVERH
jgi:3-hydroxyacyl-CoA dehydrogenase / enoyl-CoA hydratase / 3-hydroxybutyryl-CoA epimerase